MLTHFSLFTGIGGIDLAAEWAGFETVGQCEWADYPTKVLENHWPSVPRWRDIHDVTAKSISNRGIKEITVLSGGFPCQPHSISGKRKATGDERDLWPEYRRVIGEIKPKWVLGENEKISYYIASKKLDGLASGTLKIDTLKQSGEFKRIHKDLMESGGMYAIRMRKTAI